MSSDTHHITRVRTNEAASDAAKWTRRRDIPLAILAWIALTMLILWAAGHIARTLIMLVIAALLAYALVPAVKFLERAMPRPVAIIIVYLVVLGAISMLLYLVVSTAIAQAVSLSQFVGTLLTPTGQHQNTPLTQLLARFGIASSQIEALRGQIVNQLTGTAGKAVPLLLGFFDFLLNTVIVAVLSIYLLIDGARVTHWLRNNAPLPQRRRINFFLETLQRIVGGYIRGQLLLCGLIGLLVGIGMTLFHVPYALLLGVLAFLLEFIPIIGTLVSGAICVLLALTQGWLIAVLVLGYFVVVHIIEGDVVGPRIVGKAIGLHPVVSLAALIAGSELFGILGALLASPIAGVLQAVIIALWAEWRNNHPDEFLADGAASSVAHAAETVGEKVAPIGKALSVAKDAPPTD
jgi:predicted PurR-regulated permease PerM